LQQGGSERVRMAQAEHLVARLQRLAIERLRISIRQLRSGAGDPAAARSDMPTPSRPFFRAALALTKSLLKSILR
jgi:hypothetical protein